MRFAHNIWFVLILSGFCKPLLAQGRSISMIHLEVGTGANLSFFDVGGGSPGVSVQGGVLYDLATNLRIGAQVGLHRTQGTDDGTPQAQRGYQFRSNMNELTAKGVYLFRLRPYPSRKWKTRWEPRAYANLGIVQFQTIPNTLLAANTNGDYLPVGPVAAGGLGLACHFEGSLSLLFETGANISSSDYLEGFSGIGEVSKPDIFITLMAKVVYRASSSW